MLKDIAMLSDNQSDLAMVSANQAEWKTFLSALFLVMIKAIMDANESYVIKVIFLHERKKFKVELERASESAIILP